MTRAARVVQTLLLLWFPLLALVLLWDALVNGRALLPAEFLNAFAPWSAGAHAPLPQGPPGRAAPLWNPLQWDGMAEFLPWRLFLARSFAAGRIPLWDPYVLCGTPFLANSQSAPLYPLHALFSLVGGRPQAVAAAMGWLAFVHLSLAGVFATLLARDHGARVEAALAGGTAFQLSAFAVAWLELPSFIAVTCWIPLVLLCVGRAVRLRSWGWSAGAGAAIGVMLLAGHLQVALYGLLAAGMVWLFETYSRASDSAEPRRAWGESALLGGAALSIGLLLAAPQLLPSVELSRISHRAASPSLAGYGGYTALALPAQNWITLLMPDYYGLPDRGDFWGVWAYGAPNVMEYAGSVGIAALVLALLGLWGGRRIAQRRFWLWVVVGVVALLLAAGSPLCLALYFGVPGFAQSGSPARALVLFSLAQSMLAALGAEWLCRQAETGWTAPARAVAAALGGAVLLVGAAHVLAATHLPFEGADGLRVVSYPALLRALLYGVGLAVVVTLIAWLFRENRAAHRAAAVGWCAVIVVGAGQVLASGAYNPTAPYSAVYPPTPLTASLHEAGGRVATLNREWSLTRPSPALLPPNAPLAGEWRDAEGYDSLYLGTYRRLANLTAEPEADASPATNGNMLFVKSASSPLMPYLAAEYVVSRAPLHRDGLIPAADFPSPGKDGPYVYRDTYAQPEAYLASRWTVADDVPGLAALRSLPPSGTALLAPGPSTPPASSTPPPQFGSVALRRITPHRIIASATAAVPSVLVLAEGLAPGWRATLRAGSGPAHPAPILRANVAFQGVAVPAGPVEVEWRYEPASFRTGLFLALAAIAGLAGAVAGGFRRSRAGTDTASWQPEG